MKLKPCRVVEFEASSKRDGTTRGQITLSFFDLSWRRHRFMIRGWNVSGWHDGGREVDVVRDTFAGKQPGAACGRPQKYHLKIE